MQIFKDLQYAGMGGNLIFSRPQGAVRTDNPTCQTQGKAMPHHPFSLKLMGNAAKANAPLDQNAMIAIMRPRAVDFISEKPKGREEEKKRREHQKRKKSGSAHGPGLL
ncbi:hypothetical protein JCM17846_05630 [Iodidimonas nitroreducens]|uniref:Uncharacterized protein n=1 Tax=Iodidimonas nitroreducens TaxID=1236968 RepID=A0A5A7N3N3_9PROT|nr:hypothetical protein JCM17846_05630 [Iodidimonas nitroreducens]